VTLVAISQRVAGDPGTGERRDALDQRWTAFLEAVGLRPLIVPNHADTAAALLRAFEPAGAILTGGPTSTSSRPDTRPSGTRRKPY